MATYQELRTRSQQVRDEQNIGGNTALRVGQLLMDIVKYFHDNDAAASEYLQQHFAMVNDGTHLLNWQQSPIVILHTMGETYDDSDFSSLSQGENYYRAGFIMEANGQGGGTNGETPKANVLYVNLANDTLYTWNGSSFDAITSGGGGGSISGDDIIKNAYYSNGNLVLIIETEGGDKMVTIPVTFDASNYVPTSRTVNGKALSNNITLSQSDIPGLVAALAAKVGYSDDEWLQVKAGAMQAATAVPNTTTVNGKRLNDNITIQMADIPGLLQAIANAGSGAVSVTTNQDGTFVIHVGSTDYTINLNHTHENMARLVVCEESDLPSTLDTATIYAITDSGETEIEKLIIRGMEFAGGGVPDTGEPMISSPSNGSTINLGTNEGSGVSKTITIKGKNLTGDLTVAVGTGLTISYGQALDASRVTIPMAQALLGAQITIAYSGAGALNNGSLVISHDGSVLSSAAVVVEVAVVALTAIKLTGTQWGQTDFVPTVNTDIQMKLKFTSNSKTGKAGTINPYFLTCYTLKGTNQQYAHAASWPRDNSFVDNTTFRFAPIVSASTPTWIDMPMASGLVDNSLLTFLHGGAFSFRSGENGQTYTGSLNAVVAQVNPLTLGLYHTSGGVDQIFDSFDLTVYELKITDNGTLVRNYVPVRRMGVPGLYDTITGHFMSSKSSTDFVEIS